jgi:hypothetical protein
VSDDDHELRSRLERLASSAGDPPEHGLEQVAARRHRRQHRRRGAVATAAVLAVLLGLLAIRPLGEGPDNVTASEAVPPAPARAEIPNVLDVRCKPAGIEVPVASVRPQRDGMHMHVVNATGGPTKVEVRSTHWSSGPLAVPVGFRDVRQPVPPGVLTIGCDIDGRRDQRRVDLVDVARFYRPVELSCDDAHQKTLENLPVEPAAGSIVQAARRGLAPKVTSEVADAEIGPLIGYPGQRLSDPTADPVVQVGVPGDVAAIVHVRGADQAAAPPWTTLASVDICASALASPSSTTTTAPGRAGGTPAEPSGPTPAR